MASTNVTLQRHRAAILQRQGGKCYYCGILLRLPPKGRRVKLAANTATLDHIVPKSAGGAASPTKNCVVACHACNSERGNRDARLFLLEKQGAL